MRAIWALIVVVVIGVAAWWLFGRSVEQRDGASEVSGVAARTPASEGHGPMLTGVGPLPGANRAGTCVIVGHVTHAGAVAEAGITVQRVAGSEALRTRFTDPAPMLKALFRLEPEALGAPEAEARTQGGAFEVAALAFGLYRVTARDQAGHEAETLAALLEERPRVDLTLALVDTGELLEGRVVWSDGTPVRGRLGVEADAEGAALFGMGSLWGPVDLDAEGRFRVEGLRAGVVAVRVVTVEGVLAREGRIVVPQKEPFVLTLEARTQTVRGTVLSAVGDGALPGAMVIATMEGGGDRIFSLTRATTAQDGTFALATGPLPVRLMASASGFASQDVRAAEPDGNVMRLRPLARVTGRVTAASDGRPIEGAGVVADAGPRMLTAQTGPDGRFEIEGLEGRSVLVLVRGGGWVSAGLGELESATRSPFLHALEPGRPLEVALSAVPAVALEGRVLDGADAGVVGARIEIEHLGFAAGGAAGPSASEGWEGTTSGPDGTFRLADLPPGAQVQLQVRSAAGANTRSGPHAVGGPPIEIRLESARWVDVTVLYADDGTPVVGARVSLNARTSSGSRGVGGRVTDAQGRTRAGPAGPGALFVEVRSEDLARGQPETPVEDARGDARDLKVSVRVARGAELRGRVLLPDGSAASGAWVRMPGPWDDHGPTPAVRAGTDGAFRLRGLPAGEHELTSQLEVGERLYRGSVRANAGRTDVVLPLEDTAKDLLTLRVRVLDARGEPVPRARVQALVDGRGGDSVEVSRGVTLWRSPLGSAVAKALEAGTLVLEVTGAATTDGAALPWGPAQVGPLDRAQREVEIRLPPERAIEGRVLDAEGKPLAGVTLSAERAEQRQGAGYGEPEAQTDAEGRFRIGRLGTETRRLRVSPPVGFLTPEARDVEPGGAALEVRLVRGLSARIRVVGEDGKGLAGAQVSAGPAAPLNPQDMDEVERSIALGVTATRRATTGADGTALVRGLDPALRWRLSVTPPSGRDGLVPWFAEPWSIADTEVRLESGLTVEGFVRDAAGAPVPEALVYAGIDNGWQGHLVGPDGAFSIRQLRVGQVLKLSAVGARGLMLDPYAEPQASVMAGAKNVVLIVDPGLTLTVAWEGSTSAQVQVLRTNPRGELERAVLGPPQREGTLLHFRGLPREAPYTIWVPPDDAGRYGLVRDVRAGGAVVAVQAQVGRVIKGRLSVPDGARDVSISAEAQGLHLNGTLDGHGGYEIRGVPPGRWEVIAFGGVSGAFVQARGEAEGGQTLDLSLPER